jgi:hypothetical protein
MDREQLLKRIETAWSAFTDSFADLPDARLTEPGVTGDWSVKDLLAHVSIWEDEAIKHLPHIIAGGRPPRYSVTYGGIDAFNAQMIARRSALSLAEVRQQLDDTHQRLLDVVQQLPEDQITRETRARRRLRLDTYSHYPIHTNAILAWRERTLAG